MAPLYNRYVPPKAAVTPAAVPAKSAPVAPKPAAPPVVEQKRKRERSEDEKAERKAKKLRKKEVDAPQVAAEEPAVAQASYQEPESAAPEQAQDNGDDKPLGEFAHIKNIKKRRKLEKEARKARKDAVRAAKDEQADGVAQDESPSGVPASEDALAGPMVVDAATDDVAPEDEHVAPVAASRKEEKKRKKRRKEGEDAMSVEQPEGRENEDGAGVLHVDAALDSHKPSTTATLDQPKKRRHKLEAVLQRQEAVHTAQDEDDVHLKNHTGVMAKFQKSRQLPPNKSEDEVVEDARIAPEPEVEKRDLAPFPQPVNEPKDHKPSFSALPDWLAEPTIVPSEERLSFSKLGLPAPTVAYLSRLGFNEALPVQQALLPLLLPPGTSGSCFLPGTDIVLPDIAVSAATGSGKTIAYLLPMIEAMKHRPSSHNKVRGLVVVPTRELVMQVASVAESLTKGSDLKIGIASGAGKFKDEQQKLVKTGRRFDRTAYAALTQTAQRRSHPPLEDSDEFEDFIEGLETWTDRQEQELSDTMRGLVDHVPTYKSAANIIICTPGRLLEHLSSTLGFSLSHAEWLVLDEADKLLDQQYDGFLQQLDEELSRPRHPDEQDAREKVLRTQDLWDSSLDRRVRKVVLSATMTRDISKLTALKLRRPKLVVVQGTEEPDAEAGADADDAKLPDNENGVFELPSTLKEYCVPVGDGAEKPLQLLELLRTKILTNVEQSQHTDPANGDDDADSDTSSSDDSDPDFSSSDSSSSDDSSSDDSSEDDEINSSSDEEVISQPDLIPPHRTKAATDQSSPTAPTVLIFTSSTESATRLSHLLKHLHPASAPFTTTLTKSTTKALFPSHQTPSATSPIIVISTDRAARGLDTLASRRITHVLQYDVPRSLTSYVHRVGRTARAGRKGEAWSLYTEREARWFVNEVQRSERVRRPETLERIRVGAGDERLKERFAEVLEGMRDEVLGKSGK